MNDPNRKIEIDRSSLLSLKAELLRKQEEVGRAKASTSIEDFVPKKAAKPEKDVSSKRKERREKKDNAQPTVTELEDSAQLARSKQMLAMKAKYYDRMVAAGGSLNSDENSLVMFNKKKQDTKPAYSSSPEQSAEEISSSSSESSDSEGEVEDGDKWVEYTDCLGRTRKCLKKDLKDCLARDKELAKTMAPREGQRREDLQGSVTVSVAPPPVKDMPPSAPSAGQDEEEEEDGEIVGPMPPAMSRTGDTEIGERFREMKEQWMQQEEANLEKGSIHYQDVLFDEARLHGVGYYAFSTDQQERNRQRDELDSIRETTLEAQKEREALRQARDKLIADRVRAARARQRARQGLPPEEEKVEEESQKESEQHEDPLEERRKRKAEEKQRKRKEREERRRERERADHVRPWDEGKEQSADDKEWVPAKEKFILSQHEWNELKRSERIAEFAPPPTTTMGEGRGGGAGGSRKWKDHEETRTVGTGSRTVPAAVVDSETESSDSSEGEEFVGPMPPMQSDDPTPAAETLADIPLPEELEEEGPNRSLFFTTKKNAPKRELKRRNLNAVEMSTPAKVASAPVPVPIRNELSDTEGEDAAQMPVRRREGAEIEPPATYDYYGPPDGVRNRSGPPGASSRTVEPENRSNLEASIEAGLKFLRNQMDKSGGPGTKNRWSSNADY